MNIPVSHASDQIDQAIVRVTEGGERIVLERDGLGVAALVPIEDLRALEQLEDEADARAADEARAEGGEPIPIEEVARQWGVTLSRPPASEG